MLAFCYMAYDLILEIIDLAEDLKKLNSIFFTDGIMNIARDFIQI